MSRLPRDSVSVLGSQITVDAEAVADGLGLTVEALRQEMSKGRVVAVAETGIADDDGRLRLTFRRGTRIWRIVRLADGTLIDEQTAGPGPGQVAEGSETDRDAKRTRLMIGAVTQADDANAGPLASRIRAHLVGQAVRAQSITYAMLADALDLRPPNRIRQVTEALEASMAEDAANDHPFIAALVISAHRRGLPATGFFETAHALGRFNGPADGPEAIAYHHRAFAEAAAFWGDPARSDTCQPGARTAQT